MSQPTRKRQRRKEARPEEILDAALDELSDKGIGRSTLGGIAARAGISRTTIYLYYDSKQAIFEALFRARVETTIDAAAALVGAYDGAFEDVFARVIETIYTRLVQGDASILLRALIAEGQDQAELVSFYHSEILAKGEATIAALLKAGVARGDLPDHAGRIDPRVLVSPAIFAAIWGMIFARIAPLDLEAFRRDHIEVMLRGVLAGRD